MSTIEKLYTSPLPRVRAIRNRHRYKTYTVMILDSLKRNGRLSVEDKKLLSKLSLISYIIHTEHKLYGVQL